MVLRIALGTQFHVLKRLGRSGPMPRIWRSSSKLVEGNGLAFISSSCHGGYSAVRGFLPHGNKFLGDNILESLLLWLLPRVQAASLYLERIEGQFWCLIGESNIYLTLGPLPAVL